MLPTPYNFSSPQANYFLSTIRLLVIDQIGEVRGAAGSDTNVMM